VGLIDHYSQFADVSADPQDEIVITASTGVLALLDENRHKRILVTGKNEDAALLRKYGFQSVTDLRDLCQRYPQLNPKKKYQEQPPSNGDNDLQFDCIFITSEPSDWGEALQVLMDILISENGLIGTIRSDFTVPPPMTVCCNPDYSYRDQYTTPRLTNGAFTSCLKTLYNERTGGTLQPLVYGKPLKPIYEYAMDKLRRQRGMDKGEIFDEVYCIGDNENSDIKGAINMGFHSICTRTGNFSGDVSVLATDTVDDVWDALEIIYSKEEMVV